MTEIIKRAVVIFSPKMNRVSSILVISLFIIQVVFFLSPLDKIPKIELWDEVTSLENGVNWSFDMFFSYENSPLYSFFYYLLSLLIEDTITLYYLNHIILLLGMIFISCFVLYRMTGSLLWSILGSYSFIFFGFFSVWPRINFLTSIVIFLIMLLIFRISDQMIKINTALILSYFLIFLRPEFYITFYILFIYSIYITAKLFSGFRKEKPGRIREFVALNRIAAIIFFCVIILFVFFVTPVPDGEARSFKAFGQHYSVNIQNYEGIGSDPWIDWRKIVKRDFGNVSSVTHAVCKKPGAFLFHIKRNIYLSAVFVSSIFRRGGIYSLLLIITVLFLFIRYYLLTRRKSGKEQNTGHGTGDNLILLIYMLPVFLSIVLIYPRAHYILLLWSLSLILLSKKKVRIVTCNYATLDRISAFILLLILSLTFSGINRNNDDNKLEALRSMRLMEKSRAFGSVLELGGGWSAFLKTVSREYHPIPGASVMWYKKNINTIIVTERLKKQIKEMELNKIIIDPESYRFKKTKIGNEVDLLIRYSEK